MRVFRYSIDPEKVNAGIQELEMPESAKVLHFAFQPARNGLCLWALVDADEAGVAVCAVAVVGTGHELPDGDWLYHGSALMPDGFHIFHLFEGQ